MRRVLVVRFSSLGDIVQIFPSLEFLDSSRNEVHVLTKKSFQPLFEAYGRITHIHTIPDHASFSELYAKVRELRDLDFEFVFDLHRNLRSRIVTLCLRRPYRRIRKFRLREIILYAFRKKGYRLIFSDPIDRAREALRVVGGSTLSIGKFLSSSPSASSQLELHSHNFKNGYVCISAESAWRQKEWSVERFVEVAKWVAARGLGVVWLGLRELPETAHFAGSVDLTRKLAIGQVTGVLAGARLLVCNDSGLMHLSEAAGTPVVAVFGPTSKELGFPPKLKSSVVVESDLWCRPCSKTGRLCFRVVERRKCLTDIDVRDVVLELERILHDT